MIAGTPGANCPQSLITTQSQASRCRFSATNGSRLRAADFLFALDEELHLQRQLLARLDPGFDAFDVSEHLAFVVGGAAGVDVAVANRRLERRRRPLAERIGRLDVVVSVDERDRFAGHRRRLGQDQRMAGRLHEFGRQSQLLEPRDHPLGRAAHVAGVARIGADALDTEQVREVVDERLTVGLDIAVDCCHGWPSGGRPI